jgi:peptidoglycan-associated lipoprotein
MQRGKAILGVAALALMVGCTGAREQASGPAEVEDRPVPGAEPADGAGKSEAGEMGTTGTLADAGGVEGSPLAGVEGSELTLVIYFDFDSSEVHPDDRVVVEAHAQHLAGDANMEVVLEGHADERGSREYNVALGEQRANGVRDMLRLLGVGDHQVRTVSYGEERPSAIGHEEESWSRNRRVEFAYVAR